MTKESSLKSQHLLLKALEFGFAKLTETDAPKKVIIFSPRRSDGLKYFLKSNGYSKVITLPDSSLPSGQVLTHFKEHEEILITTSGACVGTNLSFCSFIINLDYPPDRVMRKQMTARVHRLGQKRKIITIDLYNKSDIDQQDLNVWPLLEERRGV